MVGGRVKKVRERIAAQYDSQRATEMKAGEKDIEGDGRGGVRGEGGEWGGGQKVGRAAATNSLETRYLILCSIHQGNGSREKVSVHYTFVKRD